MSVSACCQCGVPFDLSLESPVVYIEKPRGKATCYDCMTCTAGCKMTLTKLQQDKIVWIWFDSPTEGVRCLPCIKKKQKMDFDNESLPQLEPDDPKFTKNRTETSIGTPPRTNTSTSQDNHWFKWFKVGLVLGVVAVALWKWRA